MRRFERGKKLKKTKKCSKIADSHSEAISISITVHSRRRHLSVAIIWEKSEIKNCDVCSRTSFLAHAPRVTLSPSSPQLHWLSPISCARHINQWRGWLARTHTHTLGKHTISLCANHIFHWIPGDRHPHNLEIHQCFGHYWSVGNPAW